MHLTKLDDDTGMATQYLLFCPEPESTIKPKDILRFASGSEKMPLLGWGEDKTPMIMFIESRQPSADGSIPVCESSYLNHVHVVLLFCCLLLPIMTAMTSKRK